MPAILEIIGPTGSGKTTYLQALCREADIYVETRHRVRQHVIVLTSAVPVWLYLQLKFCFMDARFLLLKRLCVYHAALKTVMPCEARPQRKKSLHLVDEGVFHILLMHKFASLKEQAAWAFFARQQICRIARRRGAVIFSLTLDHDRRQERLRQRNEITAERLRVANRLSGGDFGPLGVEFISSMACEAAKRVKVVWLDNNDDSRIADNLAMIQAELMSQKAGLENVGTLLGDRKHYSGTLGAADER